MAKGRGLLMVRMDILPEVEEEWNHWYDTQHIPNRLKILGFLSARRFVAIQGEFKYLTIYDLTSADVLTSEPYLKLKDWEASLPAESFEAITLKLPNFSRGVYRQIYPEQEEHQIPPTKTILAVGHDMPANREEEFNAWYDYEHIHAMKRVPGVIAARRFVAVDTSLPPIPKYVTLYDIESEKVLQSDAFSKERNSPWTSWVRSWYTHRIRFVGRRIYPKP